MKRSHDGGDFSADEAESCATPEPKSDLATMSGELAHFLVEVAGFAVLPSR
jgi:hypothetical protein